MTKSRSFLSRDVENFDISSHRALLVAVAVLLGLPAGCQREPPAEVTFTPKPKPPYSSQTFASTRLVLKHQNGGFEVISSTPSHGGVTQLEVAEMVPEVLEGKTELYEYTLRNRDGDILAGGYFTVPVTARVTFTEAEEPGRIHHEEVEDPSPIVRVAIPPVPAMATVEFKKLVPDKNRRFQNWNREAAGEARLGAAATQQRKGE